MNDTEKNRKICQKLQTKLRQLMEKPNQFDEAIQLFFKQHTTLHSYKMNDSVFWSFEDAILDDMTHEQIQYIPPNAEHSIAWNIWHIARIEDVAMNILVEDTLQVLIQEKWQERLKITLVSTGNAMSKEEIAQLSKGIDTSALRAYRAAVGRRTRKIVRNLKPIDLEKSVNPKRLQRVKDEGAVVQAAQGVIDYWSRRTIADLLLMPATRHNLVHLNESLRIKQKVV
jgi:hypothetical protein